MSSSCLCPSSSGTAGAGCFLAEHWIWFLLIAVVLAVIFLFS